MPQQAFNKISKIELEGYYGTFYGGNNISNHIGSSFFSLNSFVPDSSVSWNPALGLGTPVWSQWEAYFVPSPTPTNPTPSPAPTNPAPTPNNTTHSLSGGSIGAIIGIVIFVLIACAGLVYLHHYLQSKRIDEMKRMNDMGGSAHVQMNPINTNTF